MEIDETINRWFQNLQINLTRTNSDSAIVDELCRCVSSVFKTYCEATIRLLENDAKKLPAMALLRVMSEFIIKFLWCLNVKKNEEIEERINRWEKTGVINRKKFVKELLESEESFASGTLDKFREEISKLEQYLRRNLADKMPNVTGEGGLFEQTKNIFERSICPQAYRQFNHTIHVDTLVLTWSAERIGNSIYYTGDLEEDIDSLKIHCLSFSYMLIKVIYVHYDWRYDQIEKEYQEATSYYTNKD